MMKIKKIIVSILMFMVLLSGVVPGKSVYAASDADDEFNSMTLDSQWAWTRQRTGKWSLTGSALRLTTENLDMYNSTQTAPLLLTDVLAGNMYEIVTKVTMTPSANYHQAGLILWEGDDNFIQLNYQWYGAAEIEIYREVNGVGAAYYWTIGATPSSVWLRLVRCGTTYTGYWSSDGVNWLIVGQFINMPLGATKMGLTAYHASTATAMNADFDLFHASTLTDATYTPEIWQGWWTCNSVRGTAPCPTGILSPFIYESSNTFGGMNWSNMASAKIICRYAGCTNLRDVYYDVSIGLTWHGNNAPNATIAFGVKSSKSGTPNDLLTIPCGGAYTGNCNSEKGGIVRKEALDADPTRLSHVVYDAYASVDMLPSYRDSALVYYGVQFGFLPLDATNCTDTYMLMDEYEKQPIIPTVEFPAAPSGQVQTVETGLIYRITTSGGPWWDPTNDHYDAAISWNGTTYKSLYSLIDTALCVDYDPLNPELISIYLPAESNTLYIRADDFAGQFANNTVGITETFYYSLALVAQIQPNECSEFTYDPEADLLAQGYVEANDPGSGILPGVTLITGGWYALEATTSVLEGTHGPWHDGSNPSQSRYDIEADYGGFVGSAPSFVVGAEGAKDTVWCEKGEGDGAIAFFQAAYTGLGIRVNDTGGNWADNTNQMGWKIYNVNFEQLNDGCEDKFSIHGIIKSDTIEALAENGKWVGSSTTLGPSIGNPTANLQPGAWYMLETTGGPWKWKGTGHTTESYEMALKGKTFDGTATHDFGWQYTDEWAFANCVAEIDALGHRRVYFQMSSEGRLDIYARVNDTSDWATNQGQEGYNLYEVVNGEGIDNECGYTYGDTPLSVTYVPANASTGVNLNGDLIDGMIYAVVTSGSLWQENPGGQDQYGMQFSGDKGATFYNWPDYPGRLCYQDEGNNSETLFVQYVMNTGPWKARVASTSFQDNTGGRDVKIYTVGELGADCFAALDLYVVDPFEWIPEKREDGIVVTGQEGIPDATLVVGAVYAVEIVDGPWNDGDGNSKRYDAALSSDNGATWHLIQEHPSVTCNMQVDVYGHYKVAFTVGTEQKYKIRVNDTTGHFTNNGGSLAYKLYTSIDNVDDGSGWDNWIDDYCSEGCVAPDGVEELDVSKWVSYLGCSVTQFMAWCPRHNDLLTTFMDSLQQYEPFATIAETQNLIDTITTEIEAYDWGDDEVASVLGTEGDPMEVLFGPMGQNSPWFGGPVLTFHEGVGNMYNLACDEVLIDYIGPYAGGGVCWVMNIANETGWIFWVQLIGVDFPAFFMALSYILVFAKDAARWLGVT
jgi:hypothetical protein